MISTLHILRTHCLRACRLRYQSTSGKSGADAGEGARKRQKSTLYYLTAGGILVAGASYASVPLYRMFCQVRNSSTIYKKCGNNCAPYRHTATVAQFRGMMQIKLKICRELKIVY